MPITYNINANIVDIKSDTPKPTDFFFIDTNVWFWTSYSKATGKTYQQIQYPNYIKSLLKNNSKIFYSEFSFSELSHQIEKTEFDIYSQINTVTLKEFRHNHTKERNCVVNEIITAWIQIENLGDPLSINNFSFDLSHISSIMKIAKLDSYDLFFLKQMQSNKITNIISDDGDFSTVPGITMFTANNSVITAAQQQQKLIVR